MDYNRQSKNQKNTFNSKILFKKLKSKKLKYLKII